MKPTDVERAAAYCRLVQAGARGDEAAAATVDGGRFDSEVMDLCTELMGTGLDLPNALRASRMAVDLWKPPVGDVPAGP